FAANLYDVVARTGQRPLYEDPARFFSLTYATPALRDIAAAIAERLRGKSAKGIRQLEMTYGGGKTHTMLAVYHLARHLRDGGDPATLGGLAPLVGTAGATAWPKPQIAVFVGSSKGADVSLTLRDGPKLRTLWGYLAWRLAGEAGLKLVAEAEAARTNPGSELMVEVFR
ncbi:MAG: hypothetical protein ACP5NP_18250, partial [Acetobacteraceae bacterium]